MQGAETVLGPIEQTTSPAEIASADPTEQKQDEKQSKDSEDSDDEGSADAALGLINAAPVQKKNDLEQPVTSGGMDTMNIDPGNPD